jgi:hypothetical protein
MRTIHSPHATFLASEAENHAKNQAMSPGLIWPLHAQTRSLRSTNKESTSLADKFAPYGSKILIRYMYRISRHITFWYSIP